MKLSVHKAKVQADDEKGLRAFFHYRDLGIEDATDGRFVAHVIKAKPDTPAHPVWHVHDLDFQMVYVLKGWVTFEYEGQGKVTLEAGDCVHQPPGIRHREVEHSSDLEMLEVVSPAGFATREVEAPA